MFGAIAGLVGSIASAMIGAKASNYAAQMQAWAQNRATAAQRADNSQKLTQGAVENLTQSSALHAANQERITDNLIEGYRQTFMRPMGGGQ